MQKQIIWQKAAHCSFGSSDKIYLVVVEEQTSINYDVIVEWGRRRPHPQQSKIYASGISKTLAIEIASQKFREKILKHYVDIDRNYYAGPVTWDWLRDTAWYTHGDLVEVSAMAGRVKSKPEKVEIGTEFVVVCKNAVGVEDHFSEGSEYVAENHSDKEMLWVIDRLGRKDEWFAERFGRLLT